MQGELDSALATLARCPVSTVVAGRTDAGVHATGQVAHVDLPPGAVLPDVRRLNGILPATIRVRQVGPAPPGFDARFSALERRYAYRVIDTVPDPLRRHDTLAWPRPLELGRLTAASAPLLGLHDFAAFCRRREGATTVRTLLRYDWERGPDGVLVATVVADAFCHTMVRALVGAVLAAGEGSRPVTWAAAQLMGGRRSGDTRVVPAHGLTLVAVRYPPAEQLAAQAVQARRRRSEPPAPLSAGL